MPSLPHLLRLPLLSTLVLVSACKKEEARQEAPTPAPTAPAPAAPAAGSAAADTQGKSLKVGVVTDVGGRGDHSFNDSALRGLELWGAGKKMVSGHYEDVSPAEMKESLQQDLAARGITPVGVTPIVLQSKVADD